MKNALVILTIILLTPLFSESQTDSTESYPQVRLIDGDTVFLFTHDQVKEFDKTYERLERCGELRKSLSEELELQKLDIESCEHLYKIENEKVETMLRVKEEHYSQINILTSENKKKDKKIKLLKKTRTLFTIGGAVLGTVVGGVTVYIVTK